MSRLIDADKTIDIIDNEITMEDSVYNDGLCRAIQIIGEQQIVKAIPIEWLCRKYLDINKKSWSAVMCLIVNKIIRAWVKENDGRNC